MFKSVSLRGKLVSSYIFCVACLLAVGGTGYYGLQQTLGTYSHISDVLVVNLKAIAGIVAAQKDVTIIVASIADAHPSAATLATHKTELAEAFKRLDDHTKTYEKTPRLPAEDAIWSEIQHEFAPFREQATKILALSNSGKSEDEKVRDEIASTTFAALNKKLDTGLDALTEFQTKESDTRVAHAKETAGNATLLMTSMVFAGFCLALTFGLVISSSLSKTLRRIATSLSSGADEVASASHQVAASSEQLSSSANEQAASLQETVASVEEMSAMIGKNADNAKASQGVSTSSQVAAEKGKSAVADMMQAMSEINTSNQDIMRQVEVSNGQISDIVRVIAEIGNKTKVINDIVFQTKLLSFNASVEAARAGEHGKGFAVVAEEVGNLAQMSGAAAKEISSMLEGSIKKVEEIVAETKSKVEGLIQNGKTKIEKGTEVAKRCSGVLDEMVLSVGEVNRMVGEIAMASQEQATGVQQINQAMGQLDQVTQQNASASQETANAAESLTSQAAQLRQMVIELKRTVDGTTEGTASHSTSRDHGTESRLASVVPIEDAASRSTRKATNTTKKLAPGSSKNAGGSEVPSRDNIRFG